MDNKYTINDIAALLSEKTGEEIAHVEKFLKELVSLINEGIMRDQIVHVKGLGTFKVVFVNERESVSVNTGERIVIPSHHKLSFVPVKTVKELINKPFASFDAIEALEEDRGVINLTVAEKVEESESVETVEEGILPDKEEQPPLVEHAGVEDKEEQPPLVEHAGVEDKQETDKTTDEGLIEEIVYQEPPRPLSDREIIEQMQEENLVSTTPPFSSEAMIPPPPPPPLPPPSPPSPPPPPAPPTSSSSPKHVKKGRMKKKKSKQTSTKLLLAILFSLLFVLLAGGGWYFFFYSRSMDDFYSDRLNSRIVGESLSTLPVDSVSTEQTSNEFYTALDSTINVQPETNEADTTQTEIDSPVSTPPVSTTTSDSVQPPASARPETATSTPSANARPETTPSTPPANARPETATSNARPETTPSPQTTTSTGNNVLARVTMQSGQRLTLISEKYYGLKVFWVYIYEFNKEKIGSNPDRIPVGMEILVPTKEFYDIDPTSTTSVERATALQRRIMAGY